MKKLTLLLLLAGVAARDSGVHAAATIECSVAAFQQKAPAGTTITAAETVAAAGVLPEYCRVEGHVATPGNEVNFRLALPASWNGKFYFEGVGGFAGSFGPLTNGLEKGYASATTDTGHQGSVIDASWALNNPAKRIDFAYRGTHVTAVATKALSQAYYGAPPKHAYFEGCSNGGRQALLEAQRYPEDFDGIIAGDPSFGTLGQIRRALVYQKLLSSSDRFLSNAKVSLLSKAVLAACDAQDGLTDGLISDPAQCKFKPETLKCAGPGSNVGTDCLTDGEIEIVNAMHSDIKGPGGKMLSGFPFGHEDGASGWQAWVTGPGQPEKRADGTLALTGRMPAGYSFQNGYLQYLAFENADGKFDWRTFDIDRDGPKLQPFMDVFSPTSTDLSKLRARGGKLLLYHGWADPALPAFNTITYYEDIVKRARSTSSGQAGPRSEKFAELFLAPGMHHCMPNGPGPNKFDALGALDSWVDKGVAPTRIVASHATGGVVDRTRPLCPYPQLAKYKGTGSIDDAENFVCGAPGTNQAAAPAPAPAQRASYTPPRTPWGDPDISGNYTNKYEYGTPFERPAAFEGRLLEDITQKELQDAVVKRQTDALENAKFLGGDPEGKIGNSAEFRDIYEVSKGSRAWLVVDPPDGKIPTVTPEGRARAAATAARTRTSFGNGPFDGPEDFSLWERCVTRGFPGSMLPGVYGNSYQILQGPGYVAIRYEMIHETRVIRTDGSPHASPRLRFDMGDARGRWEGTTLVVETTNFSQRSTYRSANAATLKLTERFRPRGPQSLDWSMTVEDPQTWARPWTFAIPLTRNNAEAIEQYECHEGNHAIFNILSAARAAEKAGTAGVP